jgi:hypothetical protein
MKNLYEVFQHNFSHVKFDGKLAERLYKFQIGYINQNSEHLEFFGGNLLGVQVIRFKDSDLRRFYEEVVNVDLTVLTNDIRELDTIDHSHKVGSDIFNLTCMFLIHGFLKSNLINDSKKKRATYDVAVIFFCRCLAALLSHYFKYPADPHVAQMTYANLSNKYLIKKLGSWHALVDYRAEEVTGKSGIHLKNLYNFSDDNTITYAISDCQGRIRDMIKNYYAEFMLVHESGSRIASTGGTFFDADGEETLKDKTKSVESDVQYMLQILSDQNSLIKPDLIAVIVNINKNTSAKMLRTVLQTVYDGSTGEHVKLMQEFVQKVVIFTYHILHQNDIGNLRDYPMVLTNLKNLYLATRSNDKDLLNIRDMGSKIVKLSSKVKISESLLMASRTSLILYICLRALVGRNA